MEGKKLVMTAILSVFFLTSAVISGCSAAGADTAGPYAGNEETEDSSAVETEKQEPEKDHGETAVKTAEKDENKPAEVMPITPEEVYRILGDGKDYILLDVRSVDEYKSGHIGGALLIPVSELEGRLGELPESRPVIVYCKSGVRSSNAAGILIDNGFKDVYDMGGINGWKERGYPVVTEEQ
jgi:rhodanese-related sulfurtransferase